MRRLLAVSSNTQSKVSSSLSKSKSRSSSLSSKSKSKSSSKSKQPASLTPLTDGKTVASTVFTVADASALAHISIHLPFLRKAVSWRNMAARELSTGLLQLVRSDGLPAFVANKELPRPALQYLLFTIVCMVKEPVLLASERSIALAELGEHFAQRASLAIERVTAVFTNHKHNCANDAEANATAALRHDPRMRWVADVTDMDRSFMLYKYQHVAADEAAQARRLAHRLSDQRLVDFDPRYQAPCTGYSNDTRKHCKPFYVVTGDESYMREVRLSPVYVPDKKLLYCGIPKCGVARWRRLMRRMMGVDKWADTRVHTPHVNGLSYLSDLPCTKASRFINSEAVFAFIIVRNPYARVLSAWLDKHQNPAFNLSQTFTGYIQWINQTDHMSTLNEHFMPMVDYCGIKSGVGYDFVGKLEDVGTWGPRLAEAVGVSDLIAKDHEWNGGFFPSEKVNVAHHQHAAEKLQEFYTPELMEVVRRKYHDDFVTFGYRDDVLA